MHFTPRAAAMNEKQRTKIVINMNYALELEKMGHRILGTLPNNRDASKLVWIFLEDDTLLRDLDGLINRGRGNE